MSKCVFFVYTYTYTEVLSNTIIAGRAKRSIKYNVISPLLYSYTDHWCTIFIISSAMFTQKRDTLTTSRYFLSIYSLLHINIYKKKNKYLYVLSFLWLYLFQRKYGVCWVHYRLLFDSSSSAIKITLNTTIKYQNESRREKMKHIPYAVLQKSKQIFIIVITIFTKIHLNTFGSNIIPWKEITICITV